MLRPWPSPEFLGDLSEVSAYVTLEPCSFHGRTPSCAKALADRGIKWVFVATLDPDPRNSGAGIKLLESAGIVVEIGMMEREALADLKPYLAKSADENTSEQRC